ncbi:MAG TPA: integrase [Pseudomonas sp.]|nr:integrase [Pseudomonas sp.]
MARGGVNLALVRKAQQALLARGQNPSIDAVRIELGNTGSKTTIQRYLKEIADHDPRPIASPSRLSDELTELVGKLLQRLMEEGNQALLSEREAFSREREALAHELGTLHEQLDVAAKERSKLESALQTQDEALKTAQSTLQSEITRNARISQSCSDLEIRVQEKDGQIHSLEQKHAHAREALEHYRASVKEQREQDLSRHEAQLYQMQQEVTMLQQTLMVKQEEITRLIRDNERFLSENRQQAKEVSHQREALQRMQGDLGVAHAATARAEGAKELLVQQLQAKAEEAATARTDVAAAISREQQLAEKLLAAEAELKTLRAATA